MVGYLQLQADHIFLINWNLLRINIMNYMSAGNFKESFCGLVSARSQSCKLKFLKIDHKPQTEILVSAIYYKVETLNG